MGDWIVQRLSEEHQRADFSCGHASLDDVFRAIEVEAIDDRATAFYGKYGFRPFPSDPRHLAIALETVQAVLGD